MMGRHDMTRAVIRAHRDPVAHAAKTIGLVALAIAAFGSFGSLSAAAPRDVPTWMVGCWSGTGGGDVFSERWIQVDASLLVGVSHTSRAGALREFEFLRVQASDDALRYLAQPGGAPPTPFTATAHDAAHIVFENPEHDFPKRIGYFQDDRNHLTAWIDGGADSARREFRMTRVSCEPDR